MVGRVAVLGIVAGVMGALYTFGFFELVQDPDASREALRGMGVFAPILYVLVFALIQPLFFPAAAIMLTGTMIWSFGELFVYSLVGAVCAAIIGFGFARYVARDFVEGRVPERLRRYDKSLEERGLRAVIVFRLLFFISPPASWLLGLSRVRFDKFVIGTAIGLAPAMAVLTWVVSVVGGTILAWLTSQPNDVWVALFSLLLGLVLLRIFMARRQRGIRARAGDAAEEAPEV